MLQQTTSAVVSLGKSKACLTIFKMFLCGVGYQWGSVDPSPNYLKYVPHIQQ